MKSKIPEFNHSKIPQMSKKLFLILFTTFAGFTASAQFVATMEIKEPIPGVCDNKAVYAIFPGFKGQKEAVCPITKEEILKRLNAEVIFLKEKPKHKDKGMINLIVNCKGEVVRCQMDNKTKSKELDKQIEAVFNSLGVWKAGKLDDKDVDTSVLYSFTIKNGVVSFG
ncbi:MAG TPA: hypothetical protein VNZ49_00615 [Bacteroidia bacterium]|nr:hypothetical protein [Bacteroidia bacterium]